MRRTAAAHSLNLSVAAALLVALMLLGLRAANAGARAAAGWSIVDADRGSEWAPRSSGRQLPHPRRRDVGLVLVLRRSDRQQRQHPQLARAGGSPAR